ncbi:hypothetical protein CLF_105481, partial [Clonorchis sinensis]
MASYGKGTNCDKLWRAWYGILITVLHLFLIYIGVTRYLHYKSQAFDPKYGGTWDQSGLNFTLAMLITSIACFFLFLFSSFIRTSNYANESTQIGRDTNNLHLLTPHPTWKPAIPLMTLPQNGGNGCLYTSGAPQNLMQRTGYNSVGAVPEDDHLSNAGADDLPPAPQYDTWSARSAMNQEQFHPHNTFNTLRYMRQDSEKRLSIHQSLRLLWHRFQRHFLPYSVVLHLLTAYCLLLPISVVHAQQIFHRALPAGVMVTFILFPDENALSVSCSTDNSVRCVCSGEMSVQARISPLKRSETTCMQLNGTTAPNPTRDKQSGNCTPELANIREDKQFTKDADGYQALVKDSAMAGRRIDLGSVKLLGRKLTVTSQQLMAKAVEVVWHPSVKRIESRRTTTKNLRAYRTKYAVRNVPLKRKVDIRIGFARQQWSNRWMPAHYAFNVRNTKQAGELVVLYFRESLVKIGRSIAGQPRLYALSKIHKADVPIRPIVEGIGSQPHELDRFLAGILKSLTGKSSTFIRNSYDFANKVADLPLETDKVLVSFDLISTYTNIPRADALETVNPTSSTVLFNTLMANNQTVNTHSISQAILLRMLLALENVRKLTMLDFYRFLPCLGDCATSVKSMGLIDSLFVEGVKQTPVVRLRGDCESFFCVRVRAHTNGWDSFIIQVVGKRRFQNSRAKTTGNDQFRNLV